MEDLSLHILDVAENSVAAGAKRIEIRIEEKPEKNLLEIEIIDDGCGMDEEEIKKALDPFYTTRTTRRVGLGLPLLAQSARETGGSIEIDSRPGKGTRIKATFIYSHIDRRPIGDLYQTLKVLILGNPGVDFLFVHKKGEEEYRLDTRELNKK
ncbi:ATP-binding protein [bacterium]|nr:ATP-binding protein [bacterium]